MKIVRNTCFLVLLAIYLQLIAVSCTNIDLYEKSVIIPGQAWQSKFKPSFHFTIKDSASLYQLFLVLRHNDKYSFSNIYINLYAQWPGSDTVKKIRRDLTLANNENGWLASGMDDIYEHRIPLGDPEPLKAGTYTFTIEQIMREDPLKNVLNVGLRIEKKP